MSRAIVKTCATQACTLALHLKKMYLGERGARLAPKGARSHLSRQGSAFPLPVGKDILKPEVLEHPDRCPSTARLTRQTSPSVLVGR